MLRIWHNPRCSKSRATLSLLEQQGHEPEVFRYLDTPPDNATLQAVLGKLQMAPANLLRRGEAAWKEAGLSLDSPEDEIRSLMTANPILIERPIVETADRAAIGRPPEAVLEIL